MECGQCASGHLIWIVNVPSRPSGQLSHIQLTFQAQAPAPLPAAQDSLHTRTGCSEPLTCAAHCLMLSYTINTYIHLWIMPHWIIVRIVF